MLSWRYRRPFTESICFPFTLFPHSTSHLFQFFPEWWTCTTYHVSAMTKMCSGSSRWLWRHQCGPCGQIWRHRHCQSLSVKCAPPAIIPACHPWPLAPLHHDTTQFHQLSGWQCCITCIVLCTLCIPRCHDIAQLCRHGLRTKKKDNT